MKNNHTSQWIVDDMQPMLQCADGSSPTITTRIGTASISHMVSLGHYPDQGVLVQGHMSEGNKEYSPRTDGVSNTLSTSTKDNMLAMPELRMEDGCMVDKEGRKYRIRKLTPTECFRLQDVSDEDIEKIRSYRDDETAVICDANGEPIMNMDFDKPSKNARKITITVNGGQREYYSSQLIWKNKGKGISKTAQYKLAGNSICVAPMYHIFRKLFIEKECENQQLELF